ncbi:MAG: hypothetical protein HC941_26195 [Microcoleus sp. SU_5_3]|nr:hypothetical protein [Microcoleus sp. SU_5_3]
MKNVTTAGLFVEKWHCRVLNLRNINISTGDRKPSFLRQYFVTANRFSKNPVSLMVMRNSR